MTNYTGSPDSAVKKFYKELKIVKWIFSGWYAINPVGTRLIAYQQIESFTNDRNSILNTSQTFYLLSLFLALLAAGLQIQRSGGT